LDGEVTLIREGGSYLSLKATAPSLFVLLHAR